VRSVAVGYRFDILRLRPKCLPNWFAATSKERTAGEVFMDNDAVVVGIASGEVAEGGSRYATRRLVRRRAEGLINTSAGIPNFLCKRRIISSESGRSPRMTS